MVRLLIMVAFAVVMAVPGWAEQPIAPNITGEHTNQPSNNESEAPAQADDLSWWTVDSGGGEASSGSFTLNATIGQPDAGVSYHSDSGWVISGGLWSGAEDFSSVFLDGFESGDASLWSSVVGGSR